MQLGVVDLDELQECQAIDVRIELQDFHLLSFSGFLLLLDIIQVLNLPFWSVLLV
jgi:hypothetical protein